jgi:hypothetical protein
MSSWLRRALLTAVLAGGALILGAGVAGADILGGYDGVRSGAGFDRILQTQEGSNSNRTDQEANADASTTQYNVNAPVAILSPGSNNGDVDQSNDATTVAVASNWNDTDQSIWQSQRATSRGGRCGCRGRRIDQDQTASNSNRTDQDANATAETTQVNVNAPVAILSPGSNNGDVDQSNDATTIAEASNWNDTDQFIGQSQDARAGGRGCCGGSSRGIRQDQSATNDNSTYQDANADASTTQYNVNAPIAILSPGSNNGDVSQSNDATTVARASNSNSTNQGIHQRQGAKSKGSPRCDGHHRCHCCCKCDKEGCHRVTA